MARCTCLPHSLVFLNECHRIPDPSPRGWYRCSGSRPYPREHSTFSSQITKEKGKLEPDCDGGAVRCVGRTHRVLWACHLTEAFKVYTLNLNVACASILFAVGQLVSNDQHLAHVAFSVIPSRRGTEGVGQEVPQEGVKVSDKPAPISHSQRAAGPPPARGAQGERRGRG